MPAPRFPRLLLLTALAAGCGRAQPDAAAPPADPPAAGAAGVQLRKGPDGWQLLRGGEPYVIKGAGGTGSPELLRKLGGNSIRTWGAEQLEAEVAAAEKNGLTVCAGLWVGHRRHGFNYDDPAQVARQAEQVRQTVLKFKDSPSILLWAVGNEMEGPGGDGDDPAVWAAVNDLAKLVKQLDPSRPTMTVVAEIGGARVRSVHARCPDVDILGINSYGGAATLGRRYREAGGTKPYVLTEFGPPGPWEVAKLKWGAPVEPSSTEKAATYRRAYQAAADDRALCLGSYAFLWGSKQETTATWYGMLLPDGSRLGPADALAEAWSGRPPPNRCPVIASLTVAGPAEVEAGATVKAALAASDPDGDPLAVT
jgi:hypothetical protein